MADRTSARLFGDLFTKLAEVRRGGIGGSTMKMLDDLIVWVWYQSREYDFNPYQMDCDEALKELGLLRKSDDGGYEYGPEEED